MVDWTAKKVIDKIGAGVTCWMIKTAAALNGNPVHLNIEGYAWRQHENQMNHGLDFVKDYSNRVHLARVYLASKIHQRTIVERID